MAVFTLARKPKKNDPPLITPWPMIAVFAAAVVYVLCIQMIPANPSGSLAQRYFLPEAGGLLGFYFVGRSRSPLVLVLCLFGLPTAQAMLIYGPAESLGWVSDTFAFLGNAYGL